MCHCDFTVANEKNMKNAKQAGPRTLKKGDVLKLTNGRSIVVLSNKPLGEGGQGAVYRVNVDGAKKEYALKWITAPEFFDNNNHEYHKRIEALAKKTREDDEKHCNKNLYKSFVMPIAITKTDPSGQFGYVMEIVPKNMVELSKILAGRKNFELFDMELNACNNIAESFALLHNANYLFTDINEDNIFVNLDTGGIKICDCDNISHTKWAKSKIGRMGYVAPEVFETGCSQESDRFSLAVLIFKLLFRDDPFIGKKWKGKTLGEEEKITAYIKQPIFTLDSKDDSNRPLSERIETDWERIPLEIKNAFNLAFVKGMVDREVRPMPSVWKGCVDTWKKWLEDDPMNALDMSPVPKRTQQLFFIIDSSASMAGEKMAEVNHALSACVEYLKELERDNSQVSFEIGILQFSDECKWCGDTFSTPILDYTFKELEVIGKLTKFGKVCRTIDNAFSCNSNIRDCEKIYRWPFLLLISDGDLPRTLYIDYTEELHTNIMFKKSLKYAIGVGSKNESAKLEMLIDFTGDGDCVKNVESVKGELGELIYNVTMVFSKAAAQGKDKDIPYGDKVVE